jgi:4-amino-4-deoxy-L-arabinose transferase-like glycosyltransferase
MSNSYTLKNMPSNQENRLLLILSLLLGANALLFIAPRVASLGLLSLTENNLYFYEGFAFFGVILIGTLFYYNQSISWQTILRKFLFATFPAWLFLTYGLMESKKFHYLFQITQSAYLMLFGFFIVTLAIPHLRLPHKSPIPSESIRGWFHSQGTLTLLLVSIGTLIFFCFGLIHITKFAAVDEPLWYNNRISKYWKNIGERDWKRTSMSDKPGITLAWAAGPGLWFKTPKEYRSIQYEGKEFSANQNSIENFYLAFRLPLLIIITLLLPFFYFFIERLLGKTTALFSYAFLVTSPILIGISKIINPDSLLWIFAPLSILSYFLFLNKRFFRYLILSGVLLGLALLTKYVANILLIFFIGLIFLEYLYHRREHELFKTFLRRSFLELGILIYAALATFYLLFPAVWIKPTKLLTATIYSQAFEKVTPLLLMLLAFIFIDQLANRARITNATIIFFDRFKHLITLSIASLFLISLLITLFIVLRGMVPYDFVELLNSPKHISDRSNFIGVFLTNFYPFIFGVSPLVLFLILIAPFTILRRSLRTYPSGRVVLYLLIFTLLYYLGATVNDVAMITRYQIILFPVAALFAGISLAWLFSLLRTHFSFHSPSASFVVTACILIIGSATLFATPFPLSYASSLLPKAYHTDVKGMGAGSYEAAQYLNTLPNAKQLFIWTDKDGVCKFFIGKCNRGRNYQALRRDGLDYVVVSSDRKNRMDRMMSPEITAQKPGLIRFDQYYQKPSPDFELIINNRPSQHVRVYRFDDQK